MAKFNISVDLEWIEEDGTIDEELKSAITDRIVDRVVENVQAQVTSDTKEKLNQKMVGLDELISLRLNGIMSEFFETPKDITDKYGDVIERGVTVTQKLKSACDNFMNQSVDENGKAADGYRKKYDSRVDYFVAKSVDHNMEWAIKKAVDDVTKNLKDKIASAIKEQLGDKLGQLAGIDGIIAKL